MESSESNEQIKELKNEITCLKDELAKMKKETDSLKNLIPMFFNDLNRIKYTLKLK
jgi:uncharacterized coiled-coil DUF342 family protein